MKKTLVIAPLLLFSILTVNAQDTTRRAGGGQDTTRRATTGAPTSTTGVDATTGDTGGQMTSTGRYAAMGVKQGTLNRKDMKFVMLANSSNMMELELSQIAVQKATNPAVKDFANMMVQHHTQAGQEMKQMLSAKGTMIPDTAMLSRHRTRMDLLHTMQGAEFDRAYMRIMVDAHEEDVDEYEDETTDAKDADIRAFAKKMLPTLRTHYTRAKEVRKQLK